MILFIDATDYEKTRLGLIGKTPVFVEVLGNKLSESLLPEINKLLKKNKITLRQIHKIAVAVGPGHFSRIRTAVATANALGFALGVSIVSIKNSKEVDFEKLETQRGFETAVPFYGKAPNITKPRK